VRGARAAQQRSRAVCRPDRSFGRSFARRRRRRFVPYNLLTMQQRGRPPGPATVVRTTASKRYDPIKRSCPQLHAAPVFIAAELTAPFSPDSVRFRPPHFSLLGFCYETAHASAGARLNAGLLLRPRVALHSTELVHLSYADQRCTSFASKVLYILVTATTQGKGKIEICAPCNIKTDGRQNLLITSLPLGRFHHNRLKGFFSLHA